MTYNPHADGPLKRAISRLLGAHEEHVFLGSVPVFSDDREEQARIDEYRGGVERERRRAEKLLLDLIGRRVSKGES